MPTLENIRDFFKQFTYFIDKPADISFNDKKITTRDIHTITLRYYHQGNLATPLIIFFTGNEFVHNMFEENFSN